MATRLVLKNAHVALHLRWGDPRNLASIAITGRRRHKADATFHALSFAIGD